MTARTAGRMLALAAVVCLCSLSAVSQAAPAKKKSSAGPDVRSNAVLVMDSLNASVVYARKADEVRPIASITKLMTALVVLDGKQPLDEVLVITKEDRTKDKGSFSRLPIGAKLKRGDLLHLALMSSENRAASALGRNYPGGIKEFVRTMNMKAEVLGMKHARFADASGLSSKNVASARDLAKLVMAAERSPKIREYSTSKSHTVRVGRQMLEFRNTNSLVSNPDWDVAVQKTGFTNDAGRCLVMETTIEARPIVIILLNSFGKYTRVADAKRIRQWLESRAILQSAQAQH